jgi:hypothetical protein
VTFGVLNVDGEMGLSKAITPISLDRAGLTRGWVESEPVAAERPNFAKFGGRRTAIARCRPGTATSGSGDAVDLGVAT